MSLRSGDGSGTFVFTCDHRPCAATIDVGPRSSFDAAASAARRRGWLIGTTDDACPSHARPQP